MAVLSIVLKSLRCRRDYRYGRMYLRLALLAVVFCLLLGSCVWNSPYRGEFSRDNILYNSFRELPKHFDPAISYSSDEAAILGLIYEPPFQYHYLKRPYELQGCGAVAVPEPKYFDQAGNPLPPDPSDDKVARVVYDIKIREDLHFQPHPCFAKDTAGNFLYHNLTDKDVKGIFQPGDFANTGSRRVFAEDYAFGIRRLADPALKRMCPIISTLNDSILGMKEYVAGNKQALDKLKASAGGKSDTLRVELPPFAGVQVTGDFSYRLILKKKYPQIRYWLAMNFFTAVPKEAVDFYNQQILIDREIGLDRFPVGSGPYMIETLNPNKEIVLARNPNFHGETYPSEGEAGDREAGLLLDSGKPVPFIDKIVYSLEKEYIPYWTKFRQGYYDRTAISSDLFDTAIQFTSGETGISEDLQNQKIRLIKQVVPSSFYMGFNMSDPRFGALTEKGRALRRAIAIAFDTEERISIFSNGRGIPMQSPIPPGIFGYEDGKDAINPYVYTWDEKQNRPRRRSLDEAREWLAKAGYPGGLDEDGKQLVITYSSTLTSPGSKSYLNWICKQFDKIGIRLENRATDYNRFRDKINSGNFEFFGWGWNADYPDPENFMFLLYGMNSRAEHDGENAANYHSPEFDRLFRQMKTMSDGPERMVIIRQMRAILHEDLPWVAGSHSIDYSLQHEWLHNLKINPLAQGVEKYWRLDAKLRAEKRAEWNRPVLWPLYLFLALLITGAASAVIGIRYRDREVTRGATP
ncbi:ABC transporter substrate-binding protein [Planctomycetota bacterium]